MEIIAARGWTAPGGTTYIIDTKGRLWRRTVHEDGYDPKTGSPINHAIWELIPLPRDPDE